MSRNGQSVPTVDLVDTPRPVAAVAQDYADGDAIPRHRHDTAQLIYAAEGVMRVKADDGLWVVPPLRGVWVPPLVVHSIRMRGAVQMRTAYVRGAALDDLPAGCTVVEVSPLLRELLIRACRLEQPYPLGGTEERIVTLIVDEIASAPVAPLALPRPDDERIARITDGLIADPGDTRSLVEWSRVAGATPRTVARAFRRELGMGFREWRGQARLLRALEMIAAGERTTTVALELGYDSPSAFIAMFRRALGATPQRYFERDRE